MKRGAIFVFLSMMFALLGGAGEILAQSPSSIFDAFESSSGRGTGVVVVHQSEALRNLVGTRLNSGNIDVVNGKTFLKTRGYRIQAYSGNNQRTSKDEAFSKQAEIRNRYPEVETYVNYYAPFWKLLVGNYRSFEEASQMLRTLKADFPAIKNEIRIIEDDIRLQLDD